MERVPRSLREVELALEMQMAASNKAVRDMMTVVNSIYNKVHKMFQEQLASGWVPALCCACMAS